MNAGAQTYTYDGLDRVASRNGIPFAYAGQGDDVVSDGVETYARGPGDELLATGRGATKRLDLADGHGDVVGAFDPADIGLGTLPDSTAYDPFGQITAARGDTGSIGFQGDWTDDGTGQVDMGARWYNPGTGAFDSRDDIGYAAGTDSVNANRYTYGAAAPLNHIDPDGHSAKFNPCRGYGPCYWDGTAECALWLYEGFTCTNHPSWPLDWQLEAIDPTPINNKGGGSGGGSGHGGSGGGSGCSCSS